MRTSERLEKIAEAFIAARADLRRLMVDLPVGATLEILDSVEAREGHNIALINDEARELRRRND
jgi:hypothetical protein